jgi:hypothetical protein
MFVSIKNGKQLNRKKCNYIMEKFRQMEEIKEYRINKGDFMILVSSLSDTFLPEGASVGEKLLTASPKVHIEEY